MINVSYGWFILLFSKGKSCSAVIKCITLFSTLYLLVTATSPKCTLPLEKMIIFAGVVVFIGIHYANEWNHCGEECAVQVRSLTLALGSLWCVSSLQASLQMPSSTTLAGNCFTKILLKQGHQGPVGQDCVQMTSRGLLGITMDGNACASARSPSQQKCFLRCSGGAFYASGCAYDVCLEKCSCQGRRRMGKQPK